MHIFTVHSPLTFLVAISIIEHLQLKKDEAILISSKYKVPIEGYRVVPSFAEQCSGGVWDKLKYFNTPAHFDRFIDKITRGEQFVAYIDLMSYYQKILITHKQCRQFHFIEEGNSAYMAYDDLTDLSWPEKSIGFRNKSIFSKSLWRSFIRVLRGYNLKLISIPYHYSAFANFKDLKFYCFSINAFYNAPVDKKIPLKPASDNAEIFELAKRIVLEKEVIWIDGSNGRYTGLSEDYYNAAIDKAICSLKIKSKIKSRVYVKLRPGIKNVMENYLVSALTKQEIIVEVLPDDVILECLFMVSKNCYVLGNLTAALEYAHVFGHQSYSIYGLFEKRPPTYMDRMEGFWKNVKLLKEDTEFET